MLSVDAERAVITIGLPQGAAFNKRKAEAQANVELIAESVQAIVGERFRPVYELVDGEPEPVPDGPGIAPMSEEEIIDLIKTNFDASEVVPSRAGTRGGNGLMPQPDMNQILKQAQAMQAEMMKAQEQLKNETVEASAGGGMVKVDHDRRHAAALDRDLTGGHRPRGPRTAPGHGHRGGQRGAALGAGAGRLQDGWDHRRPGRWRRLPGLGG